MKKLVLFSALLATVSVPFSVDARDVKSSQPLESVKTMPRGIWIDVRSPEEFAQGHLWMATNIPHTEIADKIAQVSPNKETPIYLYCHSGRRAEAAMNELKKLGYFHVINQGGYEELIKKGFE